MALTAKNHRILDEAEFFTRFTPKPNHLDKHATFDSGEGGCLFACTGKELKYVLAQKPRCIWTLVDGDEGQILLVSGLHIVNRIGYLVTGEPAEDHTDYTIILDSRYAAPVAQFP